MPAFSLVWVLILAVGVWPFGSAETKDGKPRVIKPASYSLPDNPQKFSHIRVALLLKTKDLTLQSPSPYSVLDFKGRKLMSGQKLGHTVVTAGAAGIQFGPNLFRDSPLILKSAGGGFKIGNSTYREMLFLWKEANGTFSVVNELSLEDYLKSVLPSEVNPNWSLEALKAQAIAARTYALFNMIESQGLNYDVRKDVRSQVYRGKTQENKTTNSAVEGTRGQILVYKGKVFPAYFSSTCGGATAAMHDVFDRDEIAPLKGSKCGFCYGSKHFRWQTEIPLKQIEERMRKKGWSISNLSQVEFKNPDHFGRYTTVDLVSQGGKETMRASEFRVEAGAELLKSLLLNDIRLENGKIYLRGRGWGHGVGLCQYGIKKLGELGYSFQEILQYYYPGSDLKKYWQ
jgi:stage II sporulation protein D